MMGDGLYEITITDRYLIVATTTLRLLQANLTPVRHCENTIGWLSKKYPKKGGFFGKNRINWFPGTSTIKSKGNQFMYKQKIRILENKSIIVGIDIAKRTHYASIMTKDGKEIKHKVKIDNSREGFEAFSALLEPMGKEQVLIGFEPTGHYWKCLNEFLKREGYDTVLINPYHTKVSKEVYDNHRSKNDTKDSWLIAQLVREGKFLEPLDLGETYGLLRRLSLQRTMLIREQSRYKIRLKTLLDEFLPEYEELFSDICCRSSIALLRKYRITGLVTAKNNEKKVLLIIKESKNALKRERAEKIVTTLNSSIGVEVGRYSADATLTMILDQLDYLGKDIEKIELEMKKVLPQTAEGKIFLSMKGMGPMLAATILGETGPFAAFSHYKKLEKLAGILLADRSSGTYKGRAKISKRGRSLLRYALYRLTVSLVSNNEEFEKLYAYKVNEQKKVKMVALTAIVSKALRILFTMAKNNQEYDGKFVLQGIAALN
jgi:transposase